MNEIARDLIALSFLRGTFRKAPLRAVARFRDAEFDDAALEDILQDQMPATDPTVKQDLAAARTRADEIIDISERQGIEIIIITHSSYPTRLAKMAAAPPVLYVKGHSVALNSAATVAIIGTREPTPFGAKCALKLGKAFAAEATVVSGLARGCDTQGHIGCIEAGGTAVAVLAHGLDRIYPRENAELGVSISETGGCLISEYPIGTRPFRSQFVERNKLQAALSDAVIVVETDVNGGTMHTVRFAVEQYKPIACVRHPVSYADFPQTRGNMQLLATGVAVPIADTQSLEAFWKSALVSSGHRVPPHPELELSLNGW